MSTRRRWSALLSSVLILSALASCHRIGMRMSEAKADRRIREIRAAEASYKQSTGVYGSLRELATAHLLDEQLTSGTVDGYTYEVKATAESYEALAFPIEKSEYFQYVGWAFYTDESGVIRGAPVGKANNYGLPGKNDPPVRYQ
jgi:hypothetical protein